jgi:hypothetical protein
MLSKGQSIRINLQIFEIMSKTPDIKKKHDWDQQMSSKASHTQKKCGPIFKIVSLKLGELTQGTFRY